MLEVVQLAATKQIPMNDEPQLGPVARRLSATRRVLSVEDEPDIAAFLRAYFRAAGYDFVHIDPADVETILDALDEYTPDLVLLDARLRGFSGLDAYRIMRSRERWAFTPVIIVSAHSASDPRFHRPEGLDAFVPKPFNTNTLAKLVEERIDRAAELAARGRSEVLQLLNQQYLHARLADEIRVAGDDGSFCFALVSIQGVADIRADVGDEGLDHISATLVDRARELLPEEAVIGVTDSDDIAVLLPATNTRDAHAALHRTLEHVAGPFHFAGGAVVDVVLACGLAAFPTNAGDPDGLFMAADAALAEAIDQGVLLTRAL